mgnify:CR=1 FL=1
MTETTENDKQLSPAEKAKLKAAQKAEAAKKTGPVGDPLVDNGDGTLTETMTHLMWTQKDSYADLGKCLNWHQARNYVENLETGGYKDWRLPKAIEYGMIYDDTKENNMAWDHNPENLLALSEQFADGAAYWYWAADFDENDLADCCARTAYFVTGRAFWRNLSNCHNGGVRAVRSLK